MGEDRGDGKGDAGINASIETSFPYRCSHMGGGSRVLTKHKMSGEMESDTIRLLRAGGIKERVLLKSAMWTSVLTKGTQLKMTAVWGLV